MSSLRVTTRLTLVLWVLLSLILACDHLLTIQRESELFVTYMERDGRLLSRVLAMAASTVEETQGTEAAQRLLQEIDREEESLQIRWLPGSAPPITRSAGPHEVHLTVDDSRAGFVMAHAALHPGPGESVSSGGVEVASSLQERDSYLATTTRLRLTIALALAMGVWIVTYVAGRWLVGRPVEALGEVARRIGRGDFSPVDARISGAEFLELAERMEEMRRDLLAAREALLAEERARREAEHQLRHAERLATIGKLGAGVAHELGTPLNVVSAHAKMIRGRTRDPGVRSSAEGIHDQVDRMSNIIRQLLDFARRREPRRHEIDLREILDGTIEMLSGTEQARGVELQWDSARTTELRAAVDPVQIQQVLSNLIVNGLHALGGQGRIRLDIEQREAAPPASDTATHELLPCAVLTVEDSGPGIPEEDLPRIFEPFFTTKEVGQGTGLGLAVSHGIVRDHGGWIHVDSDPDRGTRMQVFLPLPTTRGATG